MDLAVIHVQEEAAVVVQHPVRLLHAGAQEPDVVVEIVGVLAGADHLGAVAAALESGAVAVRVRE